MSFEYPILDPRNEEQLTNSAKTYAFQASNGVINDFNEAGALDTLIRTQAYCGAELMSYVNELPVSLAYKVMELAGVEALSDKKARSKVRFNLIAPSAGTFIIPKGFEVQALTRTGTLSYYTTDTLEILPGDDVGTVDVEAEASGEKYNDVVINRFTVPLSGLRSVINIESVRGGLSAESVESLFDRSVKAIRRRSPISEIDFEEFAEEILGTGSLAKCIGTLSLDKNSIEPGAVHIFLLDSDGTPATQSLINNVKSELDSKRHVGTKIYVSPMELFELDAEMIIKLEEDYNPYVVADELWQTFVDYFSASRFNPGDTILLSEVQTQLRLTEGISYIEMLEINRSAINISLGNLWTMPKPMSLAIDFVTSTDSILRVVKGVSLPMDSL